MNGEIAVTKNSSITLKTSHGIPFQSEEIVSK